MNRKKEPERLDAERVVNLLKQKPVHHTTLLYGYAGCDVDSDTLAGFVRSNGAYKSPPDSSAASLNHQIYTFGEQAIFGESKMLIYAIDLTLGQLEGVA